MSDALFQSLLRLGDNTLILGHQVSAWCGIGPVLEEDIALANIALDLLGQTQMWLGLAAEIEQAGRSADDLAMLRDVHDFRNILLVEQPNGDYGRTIMRQYLFDQFHFLQLQKLASSTHEQIAEIAAKSLKEVTYHLRRSGDTVIALGDGTAESHMRMQTALDRLWPFIGEMFIADHIDEDMARAEIMPNPADLRADYNKAIQHTLSDATLQLPDSDFAHKGGRTGVRHSEHLGHLLTQMQWMQRAYPGAHW